MNTAHGLTPRLLSEEPYEKNLKGGGNASLVIKGRKDMKKAIAILMTVCMLASLFVSCAMTDELVLVSFSQGIGKSLTATAENVDPDDLVWYYTATPAPNAEFTYGATGSDPVLLGEDGRLDSIISLSQGKWSFYLEGREPAAEGQEPSVVIYTGTVSNVLIKKQSTPVTVSVNVLPNAEGVAEIKIADDVYIKAHDGSDSSSKKITMVYIDGVAMPGFPATRVQEVTVSNTKNTFTIKAEYVKDGITYGTEEVKVTLSAGSVVTIGGFIDEDTQAVDFDAVITNVPEITFAKVLEVEVVGNAAKVKTEKKISNSGLDVTYPQGVKLNADTDVDTVSNTADATTGFKYKGEVSEITNGTGVSIGAGETVLQFELTLNVAEENEVLLTVESKIGEGLDISAIYHDGALLATEPADPAVEYYEYDSATGVLTLHLFHASPIEVVTAKDVIAVAAIGKVKYETLAKAIEAVKNNETIVLLSDVADAPGLAVNTGKTFTIDFDGHTYAVGLPGAGSKGTETNGLQLLKGQKITLKNGTLACSPSNLVESTDPARRNIRRMIQNYCELTLEDMVIDGTNQYGSNYLMSFNNEPVQLIGSTSVILKKGAATAFDADGNWDGYARCAVTVDTTGTIEGNIEVGQGYLTVKKGTIGGLVFCTSCGTAETEGQKERVKIENATFLTDPTDCLVEDAYDIDETADGFVVKVKAEEPVATVTFKDGTTTEYYASSKYDVADPEITGFDDSDWSNAYKALSRAFYDVGRTGGTIVINQDLSFGENDNSGLKIIGDYTESEKKSNRFKKASTVNEVVLDLAGHSINFSFNEESAAYSSNIYLANINVTIKDSSSEKTGTISSHSLSVLCHLGNVVLRVEGGSFLTDCVNGSLKGIGIMKGGDYVYDDDADKFVPGQVSMTGGTLSYANAMKESNSITHKTYLDTFNEGNVAEGYIGVFNGETGCITVNAK